MRFFCTNGKEARYLVSVYSWNVDDHYYYHYMKDAKECFRELTSRRRKDTTIRLVDLKKDETIDFNKV